MKRFELQNPFAVANSILITVGIAFSEIDMAMKITATMLILIYWKLVDILRKLD